jgi:O-antigen ligase
MAFCLPFSTAMTIVFSTFGVLFGLLGFDSAAFKQVLRSPIAILCILLFSWLALSTFFSIAPSNELIEGISKYRKLLYVTLVAMLLVSTHVKPWFLMNFFVAGCLLVCIGSLSSFSGLLGNLIGPQLPGGGWGVGGTLSRHWFYIGPPEAPTFGRAWIAQGAFLVFSAMYLIGVLLQTFRDPRKTNVRIVATALALLTMVIVVLNLGGRTGYVLLVLGLLLWLVKLFHLGYWRVGLGVLAGVMITGAVVIKFNPRVVERAQGAITDVNRYLESGALTSQGLRLRFWEAGVRAGLEAPLLGWGVGSYAEVFSRDERQPSRLRTSRPQPHSEYVLQFVQGGVFAILCLLIMVSSIIWTYAVEINSKSNLMQIQKLSMTIIGLLMFFDASFNSILWDLGEGHAFAFIVGTIVAMSSQANEQIGRNRGD